VLSHAALCWAGRGARGRVWTLEARPGGGDSDDRTVLRKNRNGCSPKSQPAPRNAHPAGRVAGSAMASTAGHALALGASPARGGPAAARRLLRGARACAWEQQRRVAGRQGCRVQTQPPRRARPAQQAGVCGWAHRRAVVALPAAAGAVVAEEDATESALQKSVLRDIALIGLPILGAALSEPLLSLVDTVCIGRTGASASRLSRSAAVYQGAAGFGSLPKPCCCASPGTP
jgi:hypothetical protein